MQLEQLQQTANEQVNKQLKMSFEILEGKEMNNGQKVFGRGLEEDEEEESEQQEEESQQKGKSQNLLIKIISCVAIWKNLSSIAQCAIDKSPTN